MAYFVDVHGHLDVMVCTNGISDCLTVSRPKDSMRELHHGLEKTIHISGNLIYFQVPIMNNLAWQVSQSRTENYRKKTWNSLQHFQNNLNHTSSAQNLDIQIFTDSGRRIFFLITARSEEKILTVVRCNEWLNRMSLIVKGIEYHFESYLRHVWKDLQDKGTLILANHCLNSRKRTRCKGMQRLYAEPVFV